MPEHKKNIKNKYFPILIDLSKSGVLVIGGGKVGLRKVKDLLNFNVEITLLSESVDDELQSLVNDGLLKHINKSFEPDDLNDYDIVFSTVNEPETSDLIAKTCREKKILLNSADKPEFCDFILPANVIRNNLIFSVSSQGEAPFLTKVLKERLDSEYSTIYGKIAVLAGQFRKKILSSDFKFDEEKKKKLFNEFLEIDWEKIVSNCNADEAEKILDTILIRAKNSINEQ